MSKKFHRVIIVALFAVAAAAAHAESGFLDFYSPQFLAGMGGTANLMRRRERSSIPRSARENRG